MGSNPVPAGPGAREPTTPASAAPAPIVGSPAGDSIPPEGQRRQGSSGARRQVRPEILYAIATVVVAVIVVVAAIAIIEGRHHPGSSPGGQVVTTEGTIYYIPVGQYNAISVYPAAPSVLAGSFKSTFPVVLFTMDSQQFENLVNHDEVNYTWTSGTIQNYTVYHFSAPVDAGAWSLVFTDPSKTYAVTIVFYSNVTLSPS